MQPEVETSVGGPGGMTAKPWVLTSYSDWAGRLITVPEEAVEAARAAAGSPPVHAVVAAPATPAGGRAELEDGRTVTLRVGEHPPFGVHRLHPDGPISGSDADLSADGAGIPLIAAPATIPDPLGRRRWGWQVQLYQLRSRRSWGIGDYGDLATLAGAVAGQGADVLLVNPMHAVTPVTPLQRSPYYPSSRRFADQLAVAVDLLPEYLAAEPSMRAKVDALRPPDENPIDRDEVWRAKQAAFALLAPPAFEEPAAGTDELTGFAIFCALAEVHGADWRLWPEQLRRPGPAATAAADPERVRLHRWVQVRAAGQLDRAQRTAREAGMAGGIVHDLAIGVDPAGADAWLLQDDLAPGTSVGAPPDPFNQLGQDWGIPPLRPDRLAASGYSAYRQVLRAALLHGGGLRVDHVMGLFRLWWVPKGKPPTLGAYVRYDAEAMLAVLVLEAARAGALVIGEDLGTVDAGVREALDAAGVLGSAVLWFQREDDEITPLPPSRWRRRAVATVSTHDLPTAHGFLTDEHVRIRAELNLLTVSQEEEQARAAEERARLLDLLRAEGALEHPAPTHEETVLAMYRLLTRSSCELVLALPAAAVGDLRQPNLPGTVRQYPNWCLPLSDRTGRPVSLEEFLAAPGTARLATLLSSELNPPA